MTQKILIVDDEQDIVDLLRYNLEKEGYKCYEAYDGKSAINKVLDKKPDLVLMDIMMPEMDGIEACRIIRSTPGIESTLVAFLTARGEEFSELAAFEVGADDYITKPIKPRVLHSRIKAILKRASNEADREVFQTGNLIIDRNTFTVTITSLESKSREKVLTLPKKEFELLYLLASKPGKVFERGAILNKVWGSDVYVVDRTIDVHIRKIREKIGEEKIITIKGVGYKFEG